MSVDRASYLVGPANAEDEQSAERFERIKELYDCVPDEQCTTAYPLGTVFADIKFLIGMVEDNALDANRLDTEVGELQERIKGIYGGLTQSEIDGLGDRLQDARLEALGGGPVSISWDDSNYFVAILLGLSRDEDDLCVHGKTPGCDECATESDEDEGCPVEDPDCTSRDDECHDACEAPAPV